MMNTFENPFYLLKATPRDRKARVIELSDELALHGDQDLAATARNALTNPRNRLASEVAWFPGLSPRRVDGLLDQLKQGLRPDDDGLPSLCAANLVAASLSISAEAGVDELRDAIESLASHVERFDAGDIMLAINEDRQASGVPLLGDVNLVEEELSARRRFYQNQITSLLDELPTEVMVATYEALISESSLDGEMEADQLIDDLLDGYEVRAGGFLSDEADRIAGLIDATKSASDKHEPGNRIRLRVQEVIAALKTWDRIAQPIQLSKKARGLDHDASMDLAFRARSLAIHLFNEHDYLDDSKLLSSALQELFAEVAAVSDRVQEDVEALNDIEAARRESSARAKKSDAEFAREIGYETTFGLIFKDRFRLSPSGIDYNGVVTPFDAVSGVSWGAVKHSMNGIPTGTTYQIAWSANGQLTRIEPSEHQYNAIVSRLWRGACVGLLLKMMEAWGKGRPIFIANVEIRDDGLVLTKSRNFAADEKKFFAWNQVSKYTQNGALSFYGTNEKRFNASFSYRDALNTHILDFAIDRIWEGKASRLSQIFGEK